MRILISIILFVIPLAISAQKDQVEILLNSGKTYNEVPERWIDMSLELVDSTNMEDHEIYYPHALTVNDDNQIAVMAWNQRHIYVFEEAGFDKPIKLRSRKGRGPREYDIPFDMYLNDDRLWVADINLRKIDAWDIRNNDVAFSYNFDNVFVKPDQVSVCTSDEGRKYVYVLSTQYGFGDDKTEGIIHRYLVSGKELDHELTFQKLKDRREYYGYVITGDLTCDSKGKVYYSGDFTGVIRKYDLDGEITFMRRAPHFDSEEPLYFEKDDETTVYNPEAPRINADAFIIGDKLIIGRSRSKDRFIYGIDAYESESGEYLWSFKFPIPSKEFAMNENRLFLVTYRKDGSYDLKSYKYDIDQLW